MKKLRINETRFRANFEKLATFGATSDGGVDRPAFSEAHFSARQWFIEEAKLAGFDTRVDGAGNHIITLNCGNAAGKKLFLGSHLDTVPSGGRFDGALGVAAALEALQVVKEQNISLSTDLAAIDFTDEEGRFIDLFGSQAVTGTIKKEYLKDLDTDQTFKDALLKAHLDEDSIFSAKGTASNIAGYLELHIEQGPRLAGQNISIGIVTDIVGIRIYKIRFIGEANHAGTTPMNGRLDASQGACSFALAVRRLVTEQFPNSVVNTGNMLFEPGAPNVVPQRVTVTLEFRSGKEAELDRMEKVLLKQSSIEAEKFGLKVEAENTGHVVPSAMNDELQRTIAEASKMLGLSYVNLPSGAGHDAQSMAKICPAGMIFVPSVGGISHSAREFTEWQDCVNGANVLLQTTLMLVQKDL